MKQPPTQIDFAVDAAHRVEGLWLCPNEARATYVFAHGAGAGMQHASMTSVAEELAALGIATLRYNFPYMQRASKRPDPPALCHATVRAAVQEAGRLAPTLPLFAGGRSFGGRMTSQAQALGALSIVRGLVFLAFPLHLAKQPSIERATHLDTISTPMLFVQGTRDDLADRALLQSVLHRLASRATIVWLEDADHSFHVPARSGHKDADVRRDALHAMAAWIDSHLDS